MQLTFEHDCLPKAEGQEGIGCPISGREVYFSTSATQEGQHLNEFIVPDARCLHTNGKLKLVAIDGNRDI